MVKGGDAIISYAVFKAESFFEVLNKVASGVYLKHNLLAPYPEVCAFCTQNTVVQSAIIYWALRTVFGPDICHFCGQNFRRQALFVDAGTFSVAAA